MATSLKGQRTNDNLGKCLQHKTKVNILKI